MTIRQIAKELTAQGHEIRYRVRKDGGILITKIDNQRFTGAKGNALARQLTGQTLSETREIQLVYAKVAKKWKKGNLPKNVGELSYKRVKKVAKESGKQEVLRQLSEKEKYASGIAYTENIRVFKVEVERVAELYNSPELTQLAEDIWKNADSIRDEWLPFAYADLYDINGKHIASSMVSKALIKDVVMRVREDLRLD